MKRVNTVDELRNKNAYRKNRKGEEFFKVTIEFPFDMYERLKREELSTGVLVKDMVIEEMRKSLPRDTKWSCGVGACSGLWGREPAENSSAYALAIPLVHIVR